MEDRRWGKASALLVIQSSFMVALRLLYCFPGGQVRPSTALCVCTHVHVRGVCTCVLWGMYIHVCMHVEAREQQTDAIIGLELAQQARPVAMEPQGSTCLLFPRSPFMHSLCFELKVLCAFKKIFIYFTYVCVHMCECVRVCEGQRKISGVSPQRPPCFDRVSVVCRF